MKMRRRLRLREIALAVLSLTAAFDLVMQGKGRVVALYYMMSDRDIETALRFPWTSIGSDAGAAARRDRSSMGRATMHSRALNQRSRAPNSVRGKQPQ